MGRNETLFKMELVYASIMRQAHLLCCEEVVAYDGLIERETGVDSASDAGLCHERWAGRSYGRAVGFGGPKQGLGRFFYRRCGGCSAVGVAGGFDLVKAFVG